LSAQDGHNPMSIGATHITADDNPVVNSTQSQTVVDTAITGYWFLLSCFYTLKLVIHVASFGTALSADIHGCQDSRYQAQTGSWADLGTV